MGFEGFILQPVASRNPQVRGDGGGVHGVKEDIWSRKCSWGATSSTMSQNGRQGHIPGGQGLPNEDLIESSDRQ